MTHGVDAADADAGGSAQRWPPTELTTSDQPAIVPLDAPRDGVPPVVDTPGALRLAVQALAAGVGPVAVDAERASGHRYGQRAFLVQLRREGSGTLLLDPAALPDLSSVGEALQGVRWVVHAASQDLPCLAAVGMRPSDLFDTELGARLAGHPKVGLAAMVEELLGLSLAKEHSAVDWSVRPLPAPWLLYAALDVEVLLELHDVLEAELQAQGKAEWARQEFAALAAAPPPIPRTDPWRRTSGMHRIRNRRQLAAVRELWQERDAVARERDISPGRILPDTAIIEAALSGARSVSTLLELPTFAGRGARRYARRWVEALRRAHALAEVDLPPQHLAADGPPPPRLWAERDPAAALRLAAARATLSELSRRYDVPVENVLAPDTVRRLAWSPPPGATQDSAQTGHDAAAADADAADALAAVAGQLAASGARPWQIELTARPLLEAIRGAARE